MKSKRIAAILLGIALLGAAHPTATAPTPSSVLTELKAGNERFASHHVTHPHQTAARRTELASGK